MSDEIPAPQAQLLRNMDDAEFDFTSEAAANHLLEFLLRTRVNLDPQRVRLVTELGPGVGQETQALLVIFPQAIVHVIDYYTHLHGNVRQNSRVVFHQGLFVRVLESGVVPGNDVVLMNNINRLHGFNEGNVGLLTKLVGKGILLASGDNYDIEGEPWFKKNFRLIAMDPDDIYGGKVYRVQS